jgi:transposase
MKNRLSDEEKCFIIKNIEKMTVGRIGQLLNRSRSTIQNFRIRWLRESRFNNNKSHGAHGKLRTSILKRIEKFIRLYPQTTLQKIKNNFNLSVCRQTLSKYLHQMGFSKFRMKKSQD